ncbi:MAG: MFS transporter [Anaerolineales bacterium]|nr:MFS transporter [Anaerolineales bacterium]
MADPDTLPVSSGGWRHALRALRQRNFRLYWFGQIISQTGVWMQIVAQGWLVYRLTDSPLMLGLVNFVALVPVVPVSLLAGVLSDRLPRRKLMIVTELVLMLQAIVTAGLIWSGRVQIWHLMVLSFILGAAAALEQPARLAFVVDIVGKEDLTNAVALNSSVYNVARIVGPAIAGVLVAWIGEAGCFLMNGVTYLAVIAALLFIRVPPYRRPEQSLRVVGGLVAGFRYTWGTKLIRELLLIVALASFLTLPYITLMPVFAADVLAAGPEGLGFLMTSVGIGAIGGALLVASLRSGRRGRWLIYANLAGPLFLLVFTLSRNFVLSMVMVLLVGASNAVRQTLANSLIQLTAADEFHGRVMSIFNLLFNGMSRLGALGIGSLAEFSGAPWALGCAALICVMISFIICWRMPEIKQIQ